MTKSNIGLFVAFTGIMSDNYLLDRGPKCPACQQSASGVLVMEDGEEVPCCKYEFCHTRLKRDHNEHCS